MPQRKRKKRRKLTPEERVLRRTKRNFRKNIQELFQFAGFVGISARGRQIAFKGRQSEFDSIFAFKNLVIVAEDTCTTSSKDIYDHLLRKNQFYVHLQDNKVEFLRYLLATFPQLKRAIPAEFSPQDIRLLILYCSKYRLESRHKERFQNIFFLGERNLRYFRSLASILGKSIRFELFKFFSVQARDVGLAAGSPTRRYDGFVLPESPSGFPPGFKIVTFYMDPETLISLSYVLRKDGWRDSQGLYQRMVGRAKIRSMRRYLANESRVFVNNVIVSLPASTRLLDSTANVLRYDNITTTTPVLVELRLEFNSVGLIDGQHRVFAYHEGYDPLDAQIALKRKKQQLLVTGLIYPQSYSEEKQRQFEARMFLEINDKQTRARPELTQAIETLVNPFSVIAVARAVVNALAAEGPLFNVLEEDQFDVGKLKSSSIVRYGLRHIVKAEGQDTLFRLWRHPQKRLLRDAIVAASSEERISRTPSRAVLDHYVAFCCREVNKLLIAYRTWLPGHLWTLDKKISRALTATAINGLVFCLRRLIEERETGSTAKYEAGLTNLRIHFTPGSFSYKSSHWKALGEEIARQCFLP
jgi:DGQHR domain-containing protein